MPIGVLQVLDYLLGKGNRFASIDHTAAAFHDHISDDLFAIAEFFNEVAQKRREVDFQVDQIFLQEQSHDFYGGKRDLKVYVRHELVDEAQKCGRCLLGKLLLATLPLKINIFIEKLFNSQNAKQFQKVPKAV